MSQVHYWAPELHASAGGIQTFSRDLLAALETILPARQINVLLKNETQVGNLCNGHQRAVTAYGGWPSGLQSAGFAGACLRQAYMAKPRLILATHVNFGPIANLARRIAQVPYILVAHGIDVWRLRSAATRHALRHADLVLAVSRHTQQAVLDHGGIAASRVKLLPNTFAATRFSVGAKSPRVLKKHRLDAATPIILTVCRLAAEERYKGYDQILKALPLIGQAIPRVHYMLVGSGPDRPRIEKLIGALGVTDRVTLTGHVADDELADYYNSCDLFAMPSKAEGFGIVYLEALACGKPVLAGARDGARDALNDGELGLLVDADNIEKIAGEIIAVLRRQHSHPHIFAPEYLHRRVTELFGVDRFRQTVSDHLAPFLAN